MNNLLLSRTQKCIKRVKRNIKMKKVSRLPTLFMHNKNFFVQRKMKGMLPYVYIIIYIRAKFSSYSEIYAARAHDVGM